MKRLNEVIFFLLVGILLVGFMQGSREKRIIDAHYSGEGMLQGSIIQVNNNKSYPQAVGDREDYIREFLATNYTVDELSNESIENLIRIAKRESSAHDPRITPRTTVYHCKKDEWFAVENMTGCPAGSVSGRKEKSVGVFQILPSTFSGYKCGGDINNVDDQLRCAVIIYKKAGYNAWYNSARKEGLL